MKSAILTAYSNGAIAWSANYPGGGGDLARMVKEARKHKDKQPIPLGRRTYEERQQEALKYFSDLNEGQGFETREQAEYGRGIRPKPPTRVYKKSLLEKVLGFFVTYEDE